MIEYKTKKLRVGRQGESSKIHALAGLCLSALKIGRY